MGIFLSKYKYIIILIIILAIVCLGAFIYFSNQPGEETLQKKSTETTQEKKPSKEATPSATPSAKKSTSTKNIDDIAALKKAVSKKTGIPESTIDFSISKSTGKYATGGVSSKDSEVGGGYWLAVKVEGEWIIAFDGQSSPACSKVDLYEFPTDMVPECFDSNFNVVQR